MIEAGTREQWSVVGGRWSVVGGRWSVVGGRIGFVRMVASLIAHPSFRLPRVARRTPVNSWHSVGLVLLAEGLGVGFAVGIEEVFAAFFPCGFHFWRGDVPVGAAFLVMARRSWRSSSMVGRPKNQYPL